MLPFFFKDKDINKMQTLVLNNVNRKCRRQCISVQVNGPKGKGRVFRKCVKTCRKNLQ